MVQCAQMNNGNFKIPYGVSDWHVRRIVRGGIQGAHRIQGYMQAEFGHLDFYLMAPEMELSRGTTLHQIVFQFKGSELVRLEQVAEETIP